MIFENKAGMTPGFFFCKPAALLSRRLLMSFNAGLDLAYGFLDIFHVCLPGYSLK